MPNDAIAKVYDPTQVEKERYQKWESKHLFTPSDDRAKKSFTIAIPPPNATRSLHMGHALNNTIQDILIRYKKMRGFDALWVPGTDHAGIATQNVVERALKKEGKRKEDLGREKFLERVWGWKKEYGGRITEQLRRLGCALDWTRERFTMDEGLTQAVRRHFVQLYHEGLIYRGKRIINWCPRCKTALSDIETIHEAVKGHLWFVQYKPHLTVATTRPETLLGDTAVAVNPEDARFINLVGKKVILPLVNQEIPIIADSFVDPSFGTGAVKVTPAHDPNDYEMALRHSLPMPVILDESAKVTHPLYAGLDRFVAREKIVEDLKAQGLLEKTEDYQTSIGHCYRCKTVVEPYLSDQWFVKMEPLAKPAIAAIKDGKIKFVPERWTKVYLNWMENIRDWCISRQIWWGHRIPVWYCDCGERVVPPLEKFTEDPKVCSQCGKKNLKQDEDVLDTWFSSALWPFSTLGWPDETEDLKKHYPTDVLVTGYDIISFWVARMIASGVHFMKREPFHTVFVHGLVRDISGKKMSKSLGNVIDPVDVIDHAGSDALRFALTSLITGQGQDIKLSEQKITEARNFANKIWNAARFVLMSREGTMVPGNADPKSLADRWILSRYNATVEAVTHNLEHYEFGEAARTLYSFVWSEYCDWYVEISKAEKHQALLEEILVGALKLLHPFMPFVTEEIHSAIRGEQFLLNAPWPTADPKKVEIEAESRMEHIILVTSAIRSIRSTFHVSTQTQLSAVITADDTDAHALEEGKGYIQTLAKLSGIQFTKPGTARPKESALAIVGKTEIIIPLADFVDIPKEIVRLNKEVEKITIDLARITARLKDQTFLAKADPESIENDRDRVSQLEKQKELLVEQIRALA